MSFAAIHFSIKSVRIAYTVTLFSQDCLAIVAHGAAPSFSTVIYTCAAFFDNQYSCKPDNNSSME
ncbi:hypothetical protein KA405_00675 [Patescibacteria group bacterium]|nr:hypothetical protein [Patescibacteria group bacterium]